MLAFFHGRNAYRRIGSFICYYFYKNVILVFCEFYFAFANGFSGQIFFADWLPMLYNALWTSWPCMFTFIFERDADYEFSLKNPSLYEAGPKKVYFNFKVFWRYLIFSFIHGWFSYFLP
jgi:magnesium-transporting ATPase (P-type)